MAAILNLCRYAGAVVVALLCGLLLGACDVQTFDDAVSTIDTPTPPPPGPPPPGPPPPPPPPTGGFNPLFSEIQSNVFTPDCATSGCHVGANPPAGLNLQSANSYANLVGIASSQDMGIERVAVGNPNASYLVQKLEGTAATGGIMPPGGALLQSSIDTIRQWITDGATDDRVVAQAPVRVSSVTPMPGAVLTAAPTQIVAGFDRDLNATSVDINTFILESTGGDGSFANGVVAITATSVALAAGNPRSAVFDLTGQNLADDMYQVRLLGAGGTVIQDLDANALDGEYLGVLPSGNGVAGGDFVVQFTINTPVQLGPTLDQIQAVVFTPICSGCHSGAIPAGGLDLSSADLSHAQLVNVAANGQVGAIRVVPTDPNGSYLIQKLEGNAGGVMPPTGMLPQTTIDVVRQWITDGALR